MIFCKKCGYMLDDDAKFCTECGTPTSDDATTNPNPNPNPNPDPSQNPNPNNVPPYNGQGYYYNPQGGYPPPYNQPPYGYYPPQKRPINVGLLIFTIINFVLVGIIALWPLLTTSAKHISLKRQKTPISFALSSAFFFLPFPLSPKPSHYSLANTTRKAFPL